MPTYWDTIRNRTPFPYSRVTSRVQDQTDDQTVGVSREIVGVSESTVPVETQDFTENQDENHSNIDSRLLHIRTNALNCCQMLVVHLSEQQLTASPTVPIVYPAATPARPTDNPDARCMNPLDRVRWLLRSYFPPLSPAHIRIEASILERRGLHVSGDQNCDHQSVDCNDTGHDDGDEGLFSGANQLTFISLLNQEQNGRYYTFMMRSGRKVPTPEIPMPDFAVPYAAPIAGLVVSFRPPVRICRTKKYVHPKIIFRKGVS